MTEHEPPDFEVQILFVRIRNKVVGGLLYPVMQESVFHWRARISGIGDFSQTVGVADGHNQTLQNGGAQIFRRQVQRFFIDGGQGVQVEFVADAGGVTAKPLGLFIEQLDFPAHQLHHVVGNVAEFYFFQIPIPAVGRVVEHEQFFLVERFQELVDKEGIAARFFQNQF